MATTPPAAISPNDDPALKARLKRALAAKGPDYKPRTRHKNPDGSPKFTNRLILESSPYLLQHAHNPVNWFPWGDEAFELAKRSGRPVFLSVGYSTCHWCHVMEEESFEDLEIAKYLNEHYICIKVDREERPDIDSIYMAAVHRMSQTGGWPMNVWLTDSREPFFGGTYFPPRDGARGEKQGFLSILQQQYRLYKQDREDLVAKAKGLGKAVREAMTPGAAGVFAIQAAFERVVNGAQSRLDPEHGGVRGVPKFPSSFPVRLLLRERRPPKQLKARQMALMTLKKMAAGGIYDQVGGGFHRYSTDARWLVPHFEKMLYDNALLISAYLEAYQVGHDEDFARVVRETADYVLRDMTDPRGGFYSATDADSPSPSGEQKEGYYFTWTLGELKRNLSAKQFEIAQRYYGVSERGNFEGRNILFAALPRATLAKDLDLSRPDLDAQIERIRSRLLKAREHRPPPARDEKIQVSWNGLMIEALATAGFVLDEPRYVEAAARASNLILDRLRPDGRLRHSEAAGKTSESAFLQDYTFFSAGLISLFEATHEERWLSTAIELMDELEGRYVDEAQGGYYLTSQDHEKLLAREKPGQDGAIPSGNSYALLDQLRLYSLTLSDRFQQRAEMTERAFASLFQRNPWALNEMLRAAAFKQSTREVMVVYPDSGAAPNLDALLEVLRRTFVPAEVRLVASKSEFESLGSLVPWVKNKPAFDDRARAYVCELGSCNLPTTDPNVFQRQLTQQSIAAQTPTPKPRASRSDSATARE